MGRHRRTSQRARSGSADVMSTGTHRATGKVPRRRVAAWPIISLVLVGLCVAGWFGWNWADGVLDHRAEVQAMACQKGEATIRLAVDPVVEQPIHVAAHRWNAEDIVVHGHCIHVEVQSMPSEEALNVLLEHDTSETTRDAPTAWVPESSAWVEQLSEQRPGLTAASSRSVASDAEGDYPYLPLTGNVDGVQQRAAQSFRAFLLEPAQQTDFRAAGLQPAE